MTAASGSEHRIAGGLIGPDSCLALVQKWESDESGWIQCFGTFDRGAHAIPMLCDSMDLDTDDPPDGIPDVACSLRHSLTLQVLTP